MKKVETHITEHTLEVSVKDFMEGVAEVLGIDKSIKFSDMRICERASYSNSLWLTLRDEKQIMNITIKHEVRS